MSKSKVEEERVYYTSTSQFIIKGRQELKHLAMEGSSLLAFLSNSGLLASPHALSPQWAGATHTHH